MNLSSTLSFSEQKLRFELEELVRSAFYHAGKALEQIQQQRLYRSTHDNFESYCQDTFGYSRDYAYLKIGAAKVYHNLLEYLPSDTQQQAVLPSKQGQLRPIVKACLRSVEQVEVWNNAVTMAQGQIPSSSIVSEAVRNYLRANQTPNNPFHVGEVCQIVAKDIQSLRKYNRCWCILSEIREWECVVNTWNCELVVPIENLESWGLDEWQYQQIEDIGIRMTRLYETGELDDAAHWVLDGLAKLDRFYLSDIEEKLLQVIEQEYLTEKS